MQSRNQSSWKRKARNIALKSGIVALSIAALAHNPPRDTIDSILPDFIEKPIQYVIPKAGEDKHTYITIEKECEPEVRTMSVNPYNLSEKDRAALLVTAYFEAGHDRNLLPAKPYAIIGPAAVLVNRKNSLECFGQYGSNVTEQALAPEQFTASSADYAAEGYDALKSYEGGEFDASFIPDENLRQEVVKYIEGFSSGIIPDPTDGATFYRWVDELYYQNNDSIPFGPGSYVNNCGCLEETVTLGDHVYFRVTPDACEQ